MFGYESIIYYLGGKSLLLQTVALFETLLARIKLMKEENQELQVVLLIGFFKLDFKTAMN